jgi:hypothetical protein
MTEFRECFYCRSNCPRLDIDKIKNALIEGLIALRSYSDDNMNIKAINLIATELNKINVIEEIQAEDVQPKETFYV